MKKAKIKKGKITITITIGIMAFILTMLIFIQVKTISQTDISELEIMKESELKTELTALKTKYDETLAKVTETNNKILEYETAINEGNEASQLLQRELKETEDLLGKNDVTGPGIVITMDNGTAKNQINANDLLELMNTLKSAGAEAISINDQRIVYDSYIADINEANRITVNFIKINGQRIVAPYIIKAIGNTTYLESAVSQKKYGYIDVKISEGKNVTLERQASITIPRYNKNLNFEYVKGEE